MKKYLALSMLLFTSLLIAQEAKKDLESVKTKMDVFASKTGVITKFVDFNLTQVKGSYGVVSEARVRKIISGSTSLYFFQIIKEGKYGNSTASIEYVDLLEVIKALKSLKVEVEKDIQSTNYLENKFTTVDGFQVGYFVNNNKATWYLKLEKYGSDNTLFLNDVEALESSFDSAKIKIEELKKQSI